MTTWTTSRWRRTAAPLLRATWGGHADAPFTLHPPCRRRSLSSGVDMRQASLAMKSILFASAVLLWSGSFVGAQSHPARNITTLTNRADCIEVSLFFGGGRTDVAGRKVLEMTGVTPYDPSQVLSMEQLRTMAERAIQREGRPIDAGYTCAASIALSSGTCTLLFSKKSSPHYQVSFDSAGRITLVSGGTGYHGEGFWKRDFTNGQPVSPASGSQPVRAETNQTPSAAGSHR